jgi:geranylgeranylglycerol-phosphate geranylgeranyltransferase
MKTFWAHIKLLRPLNLATGAFAVAVSAAILQSLQATATLVHAILVVVLYNAAANAINDYFDYETDLVNRPNRPLSTGLVRRRSALGLAVLLFAGGSALAARLPLPAGIVAWTVALPLMVLYSWKLKGLPLVGNAVVSFILGLTFLFAGLAFEKVGPMLVPAALAFGLTMVRELVKDIADIEGDRRVGLRTYPVAVGIIPAVRLAVGLAILVGFGSLLPYWADYYGSKYLQVLIVGVELPLLYIIVKFLKSPATATAATAAGILKFSTIAGVVAVYLG